MLKNISSINDKCKLADGNSIPWLALGTYQMTLSDNCQDIIEYAIQNGYRHFDTATIYDNEAEIGNALKNSIQNKVVTRDELFITTKLWNSDHGNAESALKSSLAKLKLDYVDLYLIHWPVTNKRLQAWEKLISLKKQGLIKSIGVSNYEPKHIEEIINAKLEMPVINQFELSPFLMQTDLVKYCKAHKIAVESYSPLIKARSGKIDNPVIEKIAKKYNKTNAQIILRYLLQHEIIVLPKTVTKSRIIENSKLFDFTITEIDLLELEKLNTGIRTSWDPTNHP